MEFEWISPANTRQNAGRPLVSYSLRAPQLLQTSISSPAATATAEPAASPSAELPLIPSVPVPLITVGKVFAPIPQGRQTIHPEAMEAARHLGLAPMLAAAMGTGMFASPDEFWDIASLTDPLTASNLMQVSSVGQRRLLFVERGAAERLARGKDELVAASQKRHKPRENGGVLGVFKALNPMVVLEGVCDALQRGISKVAALDSLPLHQYQQQQQNNNSNDDSSDLSKSNASPVVFTQEEIFRMEPKNKEPNKSSKKKEGSKEEDPPAAASLFDSPFPSAAGSSLFEDEDIFGSLSHSSPDNSSRMAALAHIPVRLALSLLRGASGRFLLLSGKAEQQQKKGGKKHQRGKKKGKSTSLLNDFEQQPSEYGGADSLNSLQVYFLPKCDFVISSTHGDIKFSPGFLSEAALQKFYKKGVQEYVRGVLGIRRLKRRALCQRIRLAAAIVAGGGASGASGGANGSGASGFGSGGAGGGDEEEEDEGFGDSPDIYEAIQEISEEIPGFPSVSPTLGPSSSPLARAGATLATGILTLVGPLIESVGDGIDSLAFFIMDRVYKDSYTLTTASRPLGPLLASLSSYNATQAQNFAAAKATTAKTAIEGTNATALALTSLCMAVGAKLAGDALSNGPTGVVQSLSTIHKIDQNSIDGSTTLSGFSFGASTAGGGWASAAAAAAAAAQMNGESKATELTAILRSVLPSLEFNGFHEALPMTGDEKQIAAAEEMVGEVLLKETGRLGVSAEIDLNARPEQFLEDMNTGTNLSSSSTSSYTTAEKEKKEGEVTQEGVVDEVDEVRPTLGRGLILIGDPGRVLGLRTPRGFSLDGVGIPVGVDDGRRYL